MTNPIASLSEVESYLGRPLTPTESFRTDLDLDALFATLEGWLSRKLTETTITDEYHIAYDEFEPVVFDWRPVKSFTGLRFDAITNPLDLGYSQSYRDNIIARGQQYWVSYVTDASDVQPFLPQLKRIMLQSVCAVLNLPDAVRFGSIDSYSVEGLSVSYNTWNRDSKESVSSIVVADLNSIGTLRNRIVR